MENKIDNLKIEITVIKTHFKEAVDTGKSLYSKKEMLRRLKMYMNQLLEWQHMHSAIQSL